MATEHFPPTTFSAREARKFVLGETEVEEIVADNVALMVSELASNAVLHARTAYSVTATRHGDLVRGEVRDGSSLMPHVRQYGLDAPTGRGLRIVDALATRWGVLPGVDGEGKTVWFEVDAGATT